MSEPELETESDQYRRRLLRNGFVLLLFALLTGIGIATNIFRNPREAVASHLIGIIDAALLGAVSAGWNIFLLSKKLKRILFWSAVCGLYLGWGSNLLSAVFGTSRMTPLAGSGFTGLAWQENLVSAGLVIAAVLMVTMSIIAIWGLRAKANFGSADEK
jgi:hydroxylaminobenzene mutase